MDLIYTDKQKRDIGILEVVYFDMAYGRDENNFKAVIDRNDHCCEAGSFIYCDGEEYGGVVDSIEVDTKNGEISYIGRTWHGLLESKVICPPDGQDYAVFFGEANNVLGELIEALNLSGLFVASTDNSGINIVSYQMDRYIKGYTAIKKMLREFDAKLKIEWRNGLIVLSAVPRIDYSQDEEFDSSQVNFNLRKNYRPTNHLICTGQGNLRERAVIHLFTDENGGIQPYSTVQEPLEDGDYILNKSKQLLFGSDEVTDIFDYPNAEITENYKLLTAKPDNWDESYDTYFEATEDGYENVKNYEAIIYTLQKIAPYDWSTDFSKYYRQGSNGFELVSSTTTYTLINSKPSDWEQNYETYFEEKGSGYEAVKGVTTESYIRQIKKPADWSKNYNNYYVFYSDGVTSEYKKVNGIIKYEFKRQSRKPTDWDVSFTQYYQKKKDGGYELVPKTKIKPKWREKTYYTRYSFYVAPKWAADIRFVYKKSIIPPEWMSGKYYVESQGVAPIWQENTYYTKTEEKRAPKWQSEAYYKLVYDRYAVMVSEGKERLEKAHAADELDIDLDETQQIYDIGDIVGTIEQVTGIVSVHEVEKKIVKITRKEILINYEVS